MILDPPERGYPSPGTRVKATKFKPRRCKACGEQFTLRCRSCELFPVRSDRLLTLKGVTGK